MGTKTAEQIEEEVSTVVDASLERAQDLLRGQSKVHDGPFELFITLTLAVSAMAKTMDMPRETLLEGIGAAYDSLEEVGGPHVH